MGITGNVLVVVWPFVLTISAPATHTLRRKAVSSSSSISKRTKVHFSFVTAHFDNRSKVPSVSFICIITIFCVV